MSLDDTNPKVAIMCVHRGFKMLIDGTVRLTVDIDPQFNHQFLTEFGEIDVPLALAPMKYGSKATQAMSDALNGGSVHQRSTRSKEAGRFAQALFQNYFFIAPKVCETLGTDDEYHEWIKGHKKSATGKVGVDDVDPIVPAHVRRVKDGAGTSYKPPFTQIPLTKSEHDLQHQKGESAVADREQFDKWRVKYLTEWGKHKIYEIFQIESMTELDVGLFLEWAHLNGLTQFIPKDWRV